MQLQEDRLTAAAHPKYTSRTTQLNSKLTAAATSQLLVSVEIVVKKLVTQQQ